MRTGPGRGWSALGYLGMSRSGSTEFIIRIDLVRTGSAVFGSDLTELSRLRSQNPAAALRDPMKSAAEKREPMSFTETPYMATGEKFIRSKTNEAEKVTNRTANAQNERVYTLAIIEPLKARRSRFPYTSAATRKRAVARFHKVGASETN
jgi:hypothetical protein